MGFRFLLLFSLLALGECQAAKPMNQTDMQAAMSDMRAKSYHGFVILLKIVISSPNSIQGRRDVTFLMPNDEDLSDTSLGQQHLQDLILSHSIPKALPLNSLLDFPTGTLIPSGLPNRKIRVTNEGRTSLFMNNARIVHPNICLSSPIRCHGISATIKYNQSTTTESTDFHSKYNQAKSSSSINRTRTLLLH